MRENALMLSEVVDAMEMGNIEVQHFLNPKALEIALVTPDFGVDEALHGDPDDWLEIPQVSSREGWKAMEAFAQMRPPRQREQLLDAIRGRGAFRRFRDRVYQFGCESEWFAYQRGVMAEQARSWLREEGLAFEDDEPVATEG